MPNKFIGLIITVSIIILGLILYFNPKKIYLRIKKFIKFIYDAMMDFLENAQKFRHIFFFFAYIGGLVLFYIALFSKVSMIYFLVYVMYIYYMFLLIKNISIINNKKRLRKWEAFKFIFRFLFIAFLYVVLFAFTYYLAFMLQDGTFLRDDKFYNLDIINSFYISTNAFLSYESEFSPEGYMKLILLIQIFSSQVIILGFLFIIFGQVLYKIRDNI